jgi:5-methylcytosine-specific restriction protein A
MKSSDRKTIELDEPAAKSHTPPGWPIQVIELVPRGKAPKKYGPRTYRFGASLTLSVILPRRGWTLVKKTKNYAYLIPPADEPGPPFRISIAVPTPEESLNLARRSYARGQSWIGQLGEWPAWYLHERNTDMQQMWHDLQTGELQTRLHRSPPKSSLIIGEWGAWSIEVNAVGGQFALGVLPPSPSPVPAPESASSLAPLQEGSAKTVELTTYERNPAARRACIAYYGPTCQACGMNYEDKYGAIGADAIHVHHVTPLSAIGEAYQVNPVRDLIPLCANCHHVVHRRNPPYSIADIKCAIEAQTLRQRGAD